MKVGPRGIPIALAMVDGKVYAIDAVCTYEGGPLDEGNLEGYCVTCPWHYAAFDCAPAKYLTRRSGPQTSTRTLCRWTSAAATYR